MHRHVIVVGLLALVLGGWAALHAATIPLLLAAAVLFALTTLVVAAQDPRRAGVAAICLIAPATTMTGLGAVGPIAVAELAPLLILGVTFLPGVSSHDSSVGGVVAQRWGLLLLSVMLVGGWIATLTGGASPIPIASLTITTIPLVLMVVRLNPTSREVHSILLALVIGIICSTILGTTIFKEPNGRSLGLAHHPNAFAMQVALCLPLVWMLWRRGRLPAPLAAAGVAVLAYGMLESGSRSGLLAVSVVLVIWALRVAQPVFAIATAVAIACVAALGALPTLDTPTTSRLLESELTANSNLEREALFSEGVQRLLQHPILGSGIPRTDLPHNVILLTWSGLGLAGLVAFLLLVWRIGTTALVAPVTSDAWPMALGALGFLVAVSLNNSIGAPTAWLVIALLQAGYLTAHPARPPGDPPTSPDLREPVSAGSVPGARRSSEDL